MVNPFYDELGRTMRRSTPLYKPSLLLLVKRIPQHYQVQFRGVTLGHRLGFCAGPTHDHSLHKLIKSRSVERLQVRF